MMGWFKRKKEFDPREELTAQRIANWILGFQRKLADRMNGSVSQMRRINVLLLFLGVGICFGAYCLWLMLGLFR